MKIVSDNFNTRVILVAVTVPCFAQDAKTIEAAKKEGGKVVIYGSLRRRCWRV